MLIEISGLIARAILHCNLGHSVSPSLLWNKDGFEYYQCSECGLVWVSPQLTDEAVEQIYAAGFQGKQQAHQQPKNFAAYKRPLRSIEPYQSTSRLLDVGCFTGNFLLAARSAGWKKVEGTEISSQAVAFARASYGLTLHEGDLLSLNLPKNAYDAITLLDVIEHVSDPLATIKYTYALLRPGGVLYIDTPHFDSLTYRLLGKNWSVFFPWHRTIFSANNMRLALEMAGFRVKHISALGMTPFSRFNAWEAYHDRSQIQHTSHLERQSLVHRYKEQLRPLWLGFKRVQELPFVGLSAVNIHIGSKLIALAERPQ